jgi:hypothetical protein
VFHGSNVHFRLIPPKKFSLGILMRLMSMFYSILDTNIHHVKQHNI